MDFVVWNVGMVDHIPDNIHNLYWFINVPIRIRNIPNTVTHLILGNAFNQELQIGQIPDNVTHLTFGWFFNQKIEKGHLPDSIKCLAFGHHFDQVLKADTIPSNLEVIKCIHRNTPIDLTNIPRYIRVYMYTSGCSKISLSGTKHHVYVQSDAFRQNLIDGEVEGVHYIDTVVENGEEYILVNGDDYEHVATLKSARK